MKKCFCTDRSSKRMKNSRGRRRYDRPNLKCSRIKWERERLITIRRGRLYAHQRHWSPEMNWFNTKLIARIFTLNRLKWKIDHPHLVEWEPNGMEQIILRTPIYWVTRRTAVNLQNQVIVYRMKRLSLHLSSNQHRLKRSPFPNLDQDSRLNLVPKW